MRVWCVKHRDGWCAAKPNRTFGEDAENVATKCNHYVTFPLGCEKREPTCDECRTLLRLR